MKVGYFIVYTVVDDDIIMTILELLKIINSFMKAFLFVFFVLIVILRFIEIDI